MAERFRSTSTSSPTRCATTPTWPTAGWRRCCHLSLVLEKPLLLEGEAGVGKTEVAKALADAARARA